MCKITYWDRLKKHTLNPFFPNASFLYLLNTSGNLTVFCFHGIENGCVGKEWFKTFEKIPVISLYWFALQKQTSIFRRQIYGLFYSKFSEKIFELNASF